MQERHRQSTRLAIVGPGGGPFDALGATPGTATVIHAPYSEELPIAEMMVSQVRSRFRDRFDIHPEATAILDGDPVDDTTIVRAGQTLMFIRRSGEKGRLCP
jgi:hypothetical protein